MFMFLFAFLSPTNQTQAVCVSRPQVFHVVCSTRLGEKGLEPFYWSCALWVLKITALQPREG